MEAQIRHYKDKLEFEIDSWDLYEAMKAGEDVVVLDARPFASYERGHIPGAVSFPHRRMTPEETVDLRREPLYVVYCDGIGCNASTAGALKMAQLGFRTKELIGGLAWWKGNGYPVEQGASALVDAEPGCGCG